jgi:hypothetical protein
MDGGNRLPTRTKESLTTDSGSSQVPTNDDVDDDDEDDDFKGIASQDQAKQQSTNIARSLDP